jgi:uncharacterized protein (TIGR02246 family)
MIRILVPSVALLAVLVGACTDTTNPVATALPGGSSEPSPALNPAGQLREVLEIATAFEQAWAGKDATAYANLYTEDVTFIAPLANVITGRETLRVIHANLFGSIFSTSVIQVEVEQVVFLTGSIAMVDVFYTHTGYTALPAGLTETRPGVVETRVRWIVVKERGKWLIRAQQMTQVP